MFFLFLPFFFQTVVSLRAIPPEFEPSLSIELSNIREAKGNLYIAVYDRADAFMKIETVRTKKIVPVSQTGSLKILLGNLPAGSYAVSCFHDLNENGELDANLFGIPVEPYGFSNNARPKFRAPKWEETVFYLKDPNTTIPVRIEKW